MLLLCGPGNLRYYYHTQYDRRVRSVDLKAIDFDSLDGKPASFPMDERPEEDILEMTFSH